jgi:hypothetical protein
VLVPATTTPPGDVYLHGDIVVVFELPMEVLRMKTQFWWFGWMVMPCVCWILLAGIVASNLVWVVAGGCAGWSSFHHHLGVRMLRSLSLSSSWLLLLWCFLQSWLGKHVLFSSSCLGHGFKVLASPFFPLV